VDTVPFGTSGFSVSRLCLGTWNMASGSDWGPGGEQGAIDLIHHALATGCTFIDTARGYGDAEQILGKAMRSRRDRARLASKQIHCPPEKLAQAIETSLQNLQIDCLDLYICHWPSPSQSLEAFFEEMVRQRDAGRIRAIGVSNFNLEQMQVAHRYGAVSLQPPFSILWRVPDEVMQFCRENNIAVTPYSPLAQGLLTGRFSRGEAEEPTGPRRKNLLFSDEIFPHAREVAAEVDRVADRLGVTSAQVALAWVLQTPGVTCPIVGASRPEQWDSNLQALEITLPEEDYRRLDEMGRSVWERLDPETAMWGWKPD
jgi:aryl-alcohol dehydrogenase-like predicted oxidoreductase